MPVCKIGQVEPDEKHAEKHRIGTPHLSTGKAYIISGSRMRQNAISM